MAKRNTTATRATVATVATVAGASTWDGLVALARTVNVSNYVAMVAAIRAAYPIARESRNTGRTTNRRVQNFQSWMMVENETMKLNDVQIAFTWIAEFPAAIGRVFMADPAVNVAIVRGVRRDYNRGRHCPAFASNGVGVAPSVISNAHNGDVKRFDFSPVASTVPAIIAPAPVAPAVVGRTAKRIAAPAPVTRGRLVKR